MKNVVTLGDEVVGTTAVVRPLIELNYITGPMTLIAPDHESKP